MTKMLEWMNSICDPEGNPRITTPWTTRNATVATEGRFMVMVPAIPEVTRTDGPKIDKWTKFPEGGKTLDVAALKAFCDGPRIQKCADCKGRGKVDGETCWECEGSKKVPVVSYARFDDVEFDRVLLAKILDCPTVGDTITVKLSKKEGEIYITGKGWRAVLMSMRQGSCPGSPDFFAIATAPIGATQ